MADTTITDPRQRHELSDRADEVDPHYVPHIEAEAARGPHRAPQARP